MMRLSPITLASLLVGLAGAATWLLCSADVLDQAALFFH